MYLSYVLVTVTVCPVGQKEKAKLQHLKSHLPTMMIQTAVRKWPACVGLAIIIVALYILTEAEMVELKQISLRPIKVFKRGEYYRFITNAFFHEGLPHLGMNLLTLYGVGRGLERKIASRKFIILTVWSVLLTSSFYLAVATLISRLSHDSSWYKQGVKGFSGVLFHYVTLSCQGSGLRGLDFFEDVKIPAQYYPWASCLLWHLLDPENDGGTLLHVCGIVAGTLHIHGYLNFILPVIPKKKKKVEKEHEETTLSKQPTPKKKVAPPDPTSVRDARLKRFQ